MLLIQGSDYTVAPGGQYTFDASLVGQQVTITYQRSTPAYSALESMGLSLANGYPGQPVWGYLTSNYPAQALGYSGFTYVYAPAYDLGTDASVENHSFEVSTPWEAVASGDANPAAIAQDLLTNGRYGANFPSAKAGSFAAWSNYALAQNLVMSPAMVQQKQGAEWLKYLLDLSNTDVTWSQGMLKYVPLGDLACSANSASFAPNTTPAYDLTDDHFLENSADEDPLKIERRANDDTFNHVRLEYTNRANQYNLEVAEAKDAADIDRRGLRSKDVLEAHAICDAAVARMLVALLLQRELGVRNLYKFQLPWTFALLEPLDLVTVTDAYLALTRVPVRINKITELDGGDFDIEAEDCPIGMASAPAYGAQAGSGFAHDYNAAPGNVATPVFFEAPVERTQTGLEVYAALSGQQPNWGGCSMWVSLDGITYKRQGAMHGGSRYGTLTAAMLSGAASMAVQLSGQGGQLLSGSLADAQALNTLLWIDGANDGGEYMSHQTATLTGTNAYTLSGLLHSAFGTTQQAHENGAQWARVDDAIAKSGPLDLGMIGKTIYFKFTSFNVYGGGEQPLADVSAYSYYISGGMAKLPPGDVGAGTASVQTDLLALVWPDLAAPDMDFYDVRAIDANWGQLDYLYRGRSPSCTVIPPAAGSAASFYVKGCDKFGNYSLHATLITFTAANVPNPAGISHSFGSSATTATITIDWADAAPQLGLRGYEVSYDAVTKKVDASTITLPADWLGNRDFLLKTVDLRGNKSAGVTYQVAKLAPNSPTNFAGYAIDNTAVFSWEPPAKTTLPISHYILKRDGAEIGRTDKAFDIYTESESGTHTYELVAVDTDSRESAPVAKTLTVFQPPDYILAAVWVSDYSGTKNNAMVENGALVLPVNTTQTFADHFTANGWATPQAQIDAGLPLFIQPGAGTGYYEETRDYGTILASMSVGVLYSLETLAGVLSSAVTITVAQDAGFTTGVQTFNDDRALASNFRYVKVRVTVTATDNQGVGRIAADGLTITLDAKLRTEQGVASMTLGGAHAQRNIAQDYKTLWVPGMSMPPAGFALNGTTNESKIVSAAGPSGINEPVWACVDYDVASDADGGWNAAAVPADCSKGHLLAVLMRTSTNDGTSYWGTDQDSSVLDLSGGVNSNPYFWNGDLPALNTWYLVVGYLHEIGYGSTDTGISGVYNLAGTRLVAGTEFKAASGKTTISHRSYHYYNPTGSLAEVQWMARPVIIPCTVAEAPDIITYLLKCAKEYGARVPLPAGTVDVATINLTAYGDTPTSAKPDFLDIPNPKSFNIFNWSGASLVAGDVGYIVRRY